MRKIFSSQCWIEGKLQPATISIENGLIASVELGQTAGAEIVEGILMPGAIDAHVHVNEPGRTEWEGFFTATQAAAAGGITTIVDMPLNASPVTTTLAAFKEKQAATEGKLHVNCGFYAGLIPGNSGDLPALMDAGVLGVKCFLVHSGIDEFPNVEEKDLSEAMPLIAKYKLPLLAHCEVSDGFVSKEFLENPTSYQAYLSSRPQKWEVDAVDLVIGLSKKHECAVHVVHVSAADAIHNIAVAKSEGYPVTAETCPHYIYFNAEAIPDGQTLYKCAPPIREKANNLLLKKALKMGILDFVASDHSPAPPSIKAIDTGNLLKAWGGIAGLQFLLPASWTSLKGMMTVEEFIPLIVDHPAKFLKIDNRKGKIAVGYDADLIIWKPEETFEVKPKAILHKHQPSPYTGNELFGKVSETIVNGTTVYKDGAIVGNSGKMVFSKGSKL
ncbi:allantoinase AllB [Parasediminibacterium sp. JCM 36343]|uniref:allantoinase AllB n=1 Tax=Parasediminibacterium sp. JCM 36343 TaxID=3374279 RepID=UPI00397DE95B